jgi:hypothetical protein
LIRCLTTHTGCQLHSQQSDNKVDDTVTQIYCLLVLSSVFARVIRISGASSGLHTTNEA